MDHPRNLTNQKLVEALIERVNLLGLIAGQNPDQEFPANRAVVNALKHEVLNRLPPTPVQRSREIARQIGDYFLEKTKDYEETVKLLTSLRIRDIQEDGVTIYTAAPGQVIGKRGSRIDEISVLLSKNIKVVEQSDLLDSLIPDDPKDADLDYEYNWLDKLADQEDNPTE